jgi:hypothetical protein
LTKQQQDSTLVTPDELTALLPQQLADNELGLLHDTTRLQLQNDTPTIQEFLQLDSQRDHSSFSIGLTTELGARIDTESNTPVGLQVLNIIQASHLPWLHSLYVSHPLVRTATSRLYYSSSVTTATENTGSFYLTTSQLHDDVVLNFTPRTSSEWFHLSTNQLYDDFIYIFSSPENSNSINIH